MVTPVTRRLTERLAPRVRYVPLVAARSFVTRRTQASGALLPDVFGECLSESIFRGTDLAARRHGLHLPVSSTHGNSGETAAALRAMQGRADVLLIRRLHAPALDNGQGTNHPARTCRHGTTGDPDAEPGRTGSRRDDTRLRSGRTHFVWRARDTIGGGMTRQEFHTQLIHPTVLEGI